MDCSAKPEHAPHPPAEITSPRKAERQIPGTLIPGTRRFATPSAASAGRCRTAISELRSIRFVPRQRSGRQASVSPRATADTRAAMTAESTALCDQQAAEAARSPARPAPGRWPGRGPPRPPGRCPGRALRAACTRRTAPTGTCGRAACPDPPRCSPVPGHPAAQRQRRAGAVHVLVTDLAGDRHRRGGGLIACLAGDLSLPPGPSRPSIWARA